MSGKRLMLVAGERSGDMHAARLLREIRERAPDVTCFGIGGDCLAEAGMEILHHTRDMAVMGVSEVLKKYGFFRRVLRETVAEAHARRPDAVILVDYPGFNLRLAARLHGMGPRVIYYICPQVWAWHRSRIGTMARVVDRLITLFPFEKELFQGTGLAVDFVGHPLVDEARLARESPGPDLDWPGAPNVALLPGSRTHEIRRMIPVLWEAARRVEKQVPGVGFLVAAASADDAEWIRARIGTLLAGPARWRIEVGRTRDVLRQARAALVASGTATIEAALMNCPMVVAYKVSALTYWLGKRLIRVPHIGMVNIVAGRRLCPEYIQHAATPAALADALLPLLEDGPARIAMLEGLGEVGAKLGPPGADKRAADVVLDELG